MRLCWVHNKGPPCVLVDGAMKTFTINETILAFAGLLIISLATAFSAQSQALLVEAEETYDKFTVSPEEVLSDANASLEEVLEQVCSIAEIPAEIMVLLRERDDFGEILAWIVENCPDVTGSTCIGPNCEPCTGPGCNECTGPNCGPCEGEECPCKGEDCPCEGEECPQPTEGGNPGNKKPVGKATENPTGTDKHHGVSGSTEPGSTGASSTSQERGPAQEQPANPKTFKVKGKP